MSKKIIIYLFLAISILSCNISTKKDILPPEKMQAILQDIHLYDAILNEKKFMDKNLKDSTQSYYNSIWRKYNISYFEFKESLNFYSARPDALTKMYDNILKNYSEKRDSIKKSSNLKINKTEKYSMNIWSQKTEWHIPHDGKKNTIRFNISTNSQGLYTLSAIIRLFPDDGSIKQKLTVVAYYDDGTLDASSDYSLEKNGIWKNHVAKVKTNPKKKLIKIGGWILDHSKLEGDKHADVKNIELIYSSK